MNKIEQFIKLQEKQEEITNNINNNVNKKLLLETEAHSANNNIKYSNKIKFLIKKPDGFKVCFKINKVMRWTLKEHIQFLEGLDKFGTKWGKIQQLIKTRTNEQIKSHAQKFYMKLKKVKDDSLGIDLTLNTIHNINDMIKHIKSINSNFDIIKVFLYLSEKYYLLTNQKKKDNDNNIDNLEYNNKNNIDLTTNAFSQKLNNNKNISNNISIMEYNFMNDYYIPNNINNFDFKNISYNFNNVNIFNNIENSVMINNNLLNNFNFNNNSFFTGNINNDNYVDINT